MADEYIRRADAIETAVNAFNAWNLAMAAADGTREINLVFRRKELCKAVELVFRGAPAADVVEVVHGCWGDNGIAGSMLSKCSVCGFNCGASSFPYCPECGAKMDGGEDRVGS